MCYPTQTHNPRPSPIRDSSSPQSPFPWDAAVFDAHCHPTDAMGSIKNIAAMKARGLVMMATRGQDQHLVAHVAQTHNPADPDTAITTTTTITTAQAQVEESPYTAAVAVTDKHVIPAFGWHPWFSHQLYDDTLASPSSPSGRASSDVEADATTAVLVGDATKKKSHYVAVLQPTPIDDDEFISGLPDPIPLSSLLNGMRQNLCVHPAAMIGEIGLDRACRLPIKAALFPDMPTKREEGGGGGAAAGGGGLTPGGREGRSLSPYRVKMTHQVAILNAQLRLAGELGRAVSIHGVQAHGVLYDSLVSTWRGHERKVTSKRKQKLVAQGAEDWSSSDEDKEEDEDEYDLSWDEDGTPVSKLKKKKKKKEIQNVIPSPAKLPYPPRICLHSFSGPPQMAKQYLNPTIPAEIYFGFSQCINLSSQDQMDKTKAVLDVIPEDKILLESDLHVAGESMDQALEDVYRFVCAAKGWELRDGVERIGKNFSKFVFG